MSVIKWDCPNIVEQDENEETKSETNEETKIEGQEVSDKNQNLNENQQASGEVLLYCS